MTKKIILIVLGALLLLCGLGATVPGALLIAATGGDGALTSGYHRLASETPALVSTAEQVSSGTDLPTSGFGATTITLRARTSGQPIFLGVARASDVDRYLDGIASEEVRDIELSPYRVRTTVHDGLPIAEPPGDQTFWLAQSSGEDPTVEWQVTEGEYRLVMMNDDGSPGVDAEAQFGVKVGGLRGLGIGTLIFGMVIALVGLGLLIWGIRTRGRPAQPATGYPPGGPTVYGPPPGPQPATPQTAVPQTQWPAQPYGQPPPGQPPSGPTGYEPPTRPTGYEPPPAPPPPPPAPPPPPPPPPAPPPAPPPQP